ncbi:MAG TPA: cupin domain-containing protein [Candidatus Limnocylindria bacterium]|nr:cupin domain-containing protein [Candidatus Limnocylindria bacterium]
MGEDQRTFLRGFGSETYGLKDFRAKQRSLDRVRKKGTVVDDASVGHSGDSDEGKSKTYWMVGPGDKEFLSQTLQVHFVELIPGGENHGHGHQNEAHFYILEGAGYEIHDGQRYQWKKDDLVIVHTDSKHKHFNLSTTERGLALVLKAKTTWMLLGMWQQGRSAEFADDSKYLPRMDWGANLWTPGWEKQKKVITPADTKWETTRDGKVRVILSKDRTDARTHSLDLYQQEIAPGSRSAKHWHMADEMVYVLSGSGQSLQWDVEAEIDDKYYARVPKEPSTWSFGAGDVVYVPTNTVHQLVNTGREPLMVLVAQNRVFKFIGYDNVYFFEDAPEYAGKGAKQAVAAD